MGQIDTYLCTMSQTGAIMKSQVTRITAATLLSASEGKTILANLIASNVDSNDLQHAVASRKGTRAELFQLFSDTKHTS